MRAGDVMADTQEDSDADIRWLSYAQIAKIRGISRASAERIVRRAKWRRQVDNQGVTRAAVPLAYAEPERTNPPDSQVEIPPGANSLQAAIDALREQQDHERTAWREERGRLVADLDRERARADTLRDRLNTMQEQLADAHAALQAAETANARADQAETARDRAEQALTAERSRADAVRERLAEAEQTRRQAEEAAERARREAEDAQQAAAKLRQADDARRARGLLARLRLAWRAE